MTPDNTLGTKSLPSIPATSNDAKDSNQETDPSSSARDDLLSMTTSIRKMSANEASPMQQHSLLKQIQIEEARPLPLERSDMGLLRGESLMDRSERSSQKVSRPTDFICVLTHRCHEKSKDYS